MPEALQKVSSSLLETQTPYTPSTRSSAFPNFKSAARPKSYSPKG